MNKLISFRELIDLKPKPKLVKHDNITYIWDGIEYIYNQLAPVWDEGVIIKNISSNLINDITINQMSEPNIEIIEEDVVIEKLKINQHLFEIDKLIINKINEIIDLLNKKEGK